MGQRGARVCCTAHKYWKLGTTPILSKIKRHDAVLIMSATGVHPAGGLHWDRRLEKRAVPFFRAICALKIRSHL